MLLVAFLECNSIRDYIKEQKAAIERYSIGKTVENYEINENIYTEMSNIYLDHYQSIDQKATDTINIIIAFLGCVFTAITIFNIFVALKMPKIYEEQLRSLEDRIDKAEIYAATAKVSSKMLSALTKDTTSEQIHELSDLIKEYPNEDDLYFTRGFLYDDQGKYDEAERDYKMALNSGGSKITFYNSMGVLYAKKINISGIKDLEKESFFKKAEGYYIKAIKMIEKEEDYNGSYCYCNLACLYQDHKDWEKALEYFELALEKDPNNISAYYNRAISKKEKCQFATDKNFLYESAYEDYTIAKQLDPDNKDNLRNRALLGMKLFEITNNEFFYLEADKDVRMLCKEMDKNHALRQKLSLLKGKGRYINKNDETDKVLATIDEKIGDLSVEEMEGYKLDPIKSQKSRDEAIKSYCEAKEIYEKLYRHNPSEHSKNDLKRINYKINKLKDEN